MDTENIKYLLAQYLPFLISQDQLEKKLSNVSLFFIVGMGRSGSQFLSMLLNQVHGCSVFHETNNDRDALVKAYWEPNKAYKYLTGSRARILAARIIRDNCHVYGEVNSYLRYHVDALRTIWDPIILHLVRDGRSVVRSIMNRKAFTSADKYHTGRIIPLQNDPLMDRWINMDRFERVCWYWADANRYLHDRCLPIVRLEDIVSSYELFSEQVCEPLDVHLPYNEWKTEVSQPKNISQKNCFPEFEYWTYDQKSQFNAICGRIMTDLGYESK